MKCMKYRRRRTSSRFLQPQVPRNGHIRVHGPFGHLWEFDVAEAEYTGNARNKDPARAKLDDHVLLTSQDLILLLVEVMMKEGF